MSRKFVAMTEHALADLLGADLSGLDLVAIMIDGVHFADHLCVVALGIGIDGTKHPLALVEGSTENTTLVRCLLVGLRERGLDVTRPILAVLDGAKALVCGGQGGVRLPGDRSLPTPQDPQRPRSSTGEDARPGRPADAAGLPRRLRARQAQALLEALATELDKTHPGAAGSLREGLAETLTVLRLGVPPTLARTLRSTNAVESMISICRDHCPQRQTLAGRADGAALVRGRHGRSQQPVPPGQRPPPPARPPDRARNGMSLPKLSPTDCNNQDVSAA